MGFADYVILGSFFIVYGALWCLNSIWHHLRSKADRDQARRPKRSDEQAPSSASSIKSNNHDLSRKSWIPLPFFARVPVEPLLKTLLCAVAVFVEAFFSVQYKDGRKHVVFAVNSITDSNGTLSDTGELYHITMYSVFLLSGVIDLMTLCVWLPKQTSMLFLTLSFVVEGLLFYFYTLGGNELNVEIHGSDELNVKIYGGDELNMEIYDSEEMNVEIYGNDEEIFSLLHFSIGACVIFSFSRIYSATNVLINVGLGASILLQGTWLVQTAHFLFGNLLKWQEADRSDSTTFMVACFTWHVMLIALGNVIAWITMSAHVRNRLLRETKRPSNRLLDGVGSEEKSEQRVEDVKEEEVNEDEFALYHLVNVIEF